MTAAAGGAPQIPQFVLNVRRQSVEALSSWFLAQWLLGDTCNLVGCILTGSQLSTQTWTACYFIIAEMCLQPPPPPPLHPPRARAAQRAACT